MSIIDDNFESYTLGQTTFATWTAFGLGGSVQHGGDANPASAVGTLCYQFNATGGIRSGPAEGRGYNNSVTVNFSLKLPGILGGYSATVCQIVNKTSTPPYNPSTQLAVFGINPDGTLFVDSAGKNICFSTESVKMNEWMFFQLDFDFSTALVSGVTYLTVNADIILNGIQIADSGGPITIFSTPVLNLPGGLASANDYEFNAPTSGGGQIDNITVTAGSNHGVIFYPHGANPNVRISQAPIEIIELPSSSMVRLTQQALELLELPSASFVRLSQLVIELPTIGGGGGFEIYEA